MSVKQGGLEAWHCWLWLSMDVGDGHFVSLAVGGCASGQPKWGIQFCGVTLRHDSLPDPSVQKSASAWRINADHCPLVGYWVVGIKVQVLVCLCVCPLTYQCTLL